MEYLEGSSAKCKAAFGARLPGSKFFIRYDSPMKKLLITSLLAIHLIILYLGSNLFDLRRLPLRMQAPLNIYFAGVGATTYGFFAIDYTSQPVVKCYILETDNTIKEEAFGLEEASYEFKSGLPFEILYSQGAYELAARLAADHCYRTHPSAKVVKISLGQYQVPSTTEYKAGKKCSFSEYYNGTYLHE